MAVPIPNEASLLTAGMDSPKSDNSPSSYGGAERNDTETHFSIDDEDEDESVINILELMLLVVSTWLPDRKIIG